MKVFLRQPPVAVMTFVATQTDFLSVLLWQPLKRDAVVRIMAATAFLFRDLCMSAFRVFLILLRMAFGTRQFYAESVRHFLTNVDREDSLVA